MAKREGNANGRSCDESIRNFSCLRLHGSSRRLSIRRGNSPRPGSAAARLSRKFSRFGEFLRFEFRVEQAPCRVASWRVFRTGHGGSRFRFGARRYAAYPDPGICRRCFRARFLSEQRPCAGNLACRCRKLSGDSDAFGAETLRFSLWNLAKLRSGGTGTLRAGLSGVSLGASAGVFEPSPVPARFRGNFHPGSGFPGRSRRLSDARAGLSRRRCFLECRPQLEVCLAGFLESLGYRAPAEKSGSFVFRGHGSFRCRCGNFRDGSSASRWSRRVCLGISFRGNAPKTF